MQVRRDGQAAAAKQRELEGVLKTAQSGLYHLQLIEQDLGSTLDEPFTAAVKDYVAQQAQVVSLCRDSDGAWLFQETPASCDSPGCLWVGPQADVAAGMWLLGVY